MKRKKIMSFVIGAGVAGIMLVLPYAGLALWKNAIPQLREIYIPIFVLPLVWGFWNWLYISLRKPFDIAIWGAILGFILGIAVDILIYAEGLWVPQALIALALAPIFYSLLWPLIIKPLNSELEV